MPITLAEYAAQPFYEEGISYEGSQVRGDSMQFWIAPLMPGMLKPVVHTITMDAAALADAETISVTADIPAKLYRGDVLPFTTSNVLVVIKADTLINTAPTAIPVLPLTGAIADAETASTYGLLPVLSLMEGGTPETSGSEVSSRNRGEGLFPVVEITQRDYTVTCNGRLVSFDPGAWIMKKLSKGRRKIYWEARYHPYYSFVDELGTVYTKGSGPAAETGIAFVQNWSTPSGASDLQQIQCTLKGSGKPNEYKPLVVI